MTGSLEDELRRVLADPPVPVAGVDDAIVDDIGGTLAALDRRVTRARARRRAAAGLSVAAVLAGGLAGATTLGGRTPPPALTSLDNGTYGGAAQAPERRSTMPKAPGRPPPEVVAGARSAVAEVTGGTVSGPVRWVRADGGYLVQIRFTAPVSCRYCYGPAATPYPSSGPGAVPGHTRGQTLEMEVSAGPVPAPTAQGAARPRAGSALAQTTPRMLLLAQATDLSRYGPVGEFTLPR